MITVLSHRVYRHLFIAQVIALIGTGLATIALALLAFDLAGNQAGAVLGTALAIKMIAYVGVSPVAAAFAERLPRRAVLITLDLVRASIALLLPFVSEIWQVYVLIFLLQSASAAFTPTFQATIPDVLPNEKDYTRALSLSRLAYDLENLLSPALAALLLTVMSFHNLFAGTAIGFLGSAAFVASVVLPIGKAGAPRGIVDRMTRGVRIYLATPRLRGFLAVNLAVAAAGAMVIVNSVVLVQSTLGLGERETATAFAAFGAGSMLAALTLPSLLDRISDRFTVILGCVLLTAGVLLSPLISTQLQLLPLWFAVGAGSSLAQTPSGRLLRRSSNPEDRPAIFAAQFALSHGCWLMTYPLAGWLGVAVGLGGTAVVMAAIAAGATFVAAWLWPRSDPKIVEHSHDNLPRDHPHWAQGSTSRRARHAHELIIDDLHTAWPYQR